MSQTIATPIATLKVAVQLRPWSQGVIEIHATGTAGVFFNGYRICLGSDAVGVSYPGSNLAARIPAFFDTLEKHKLWGKTLSCWGYLTLDGTPVGKSKSPVVPLPMPIRCYQGALCPPDALSKSVPAPKFLPVGQSRRLVKVGNLLFFAKADGYLETSENGRGFDPFNYILALYDLGRPNPTAAPEGPVANGAALSLRLGGTKPPPGIPAAGTWTSIAAALPSSVDNSFKPLLVWSAKQAFLVGPYVTGQMRVHGWTPNGYVAAPAKTFKAADGIWEVSRPNRAMLGGQASGQAGSISGMPWTSSI